MARKKGITISLAAKCQLLFGLAVIVIIAGALAVPWQRMEQLATQPNIKAARHAADMMFRLGHQGVLPQRNPATSTSEQGVPDTAPSRDPPAGRPIASWSAARLADTDYAPPALYLTDSPTGPLRAAGGWGFTADAGSGASPSGDPTQEATGSQPVGHTDAIAEQALRIFRQRPLETEHGAAEMWRDSRGRNVRVYRYAAAIRLQASCLACHGEYANWVPPGAVVPATTSATNPVTAAPTELLGHGGASGDVVWPLIGVVRVDVPYLTDTNQLLLNRIVIVVAGMVGGALAIVVFYLITTRLILQPVRVLKNTAEKVSGGDLNIRSAISTGDEFQHLSETFNTMLANLQASRDQLEATNRSLDTRVGELAQSNVDLFEANRLKSEFLTNVTHELRTPLNAIIGFADLMADTATRGGDAKQQRYSENIGASAKQLLDLINDLLDLAKIEAGKLVLRQEKVNVADVCEALANFVKPLAQKKSITLELQIDPHMPLITTDAGRFQQILYNFLSNAIKFTPPEGRVTICARAQRDPPPAGEVAAPTAASGAPEQATGAAASTPTAAAPGDDPASDRSVSAIRIAVSDTGPGISHEDQRVIFEKFRQLDGSVTRHHSGSGLGLAISRELAHMLGGRIELASVPGKGATFALVMPIVHHAGGVAPDRHVMLENR